LPKNNKSHKINHVICPKGFVSGLGMEICRVIRQSLGQMTASLIWHGTMSVKEDIKSSR
jgi:hypothetical protein